MQRPSFVFLVCFCFTMAMASVIGIADGSVLPQPPVVPPDTERPIASYSVGEAANFVIYTDRGVYDRADCSLWFGGDGHVDYECALNPDAVARVENCDRDRSPFQCAIKCWRTIPPSNSPLPPLALENTDFCYLFRRLRRRIFSTTAGGETSGSDDDGGWIQTRWAYVLNIVELPPP